MQRLLGVETEYAIAGGDTRLERQVLLERLLHNARRELPHLPGPGGHGFFLQNGARLYVDFGGHPEFATPECGNPWDVVRHVRAGESILLAVTGRRTAIFRCNVDYSGTGATWGCHESYMHGAHPTALPSQLVPHLVSRVVYGGAGGFNNLSPGIEFRLSPRSAHIVTERSSESTVNRGIFHTKDEPLCGHGRHRLHVLFGESLCSERALWLKVGTTALVVALCEAGRRPGDAVALRAPLAAMHLFARDPTCTAAAETTDGRLLTAIAIQRHYLEQAEAHLGDACMPSWAADVCRGWRTVLDALESGWEAAATSLDWAIKLALYRERVRRRGLAWESLDAWTRVALKLRTALLRVGQPVRLDPELVLGVASPIAGEVRALDPLLCELGLEWSGLAAFLETRDELFEIDTRFGRLGSHGIFTALEAAGVLGHHVDGVGDIAHAVEHPPDVPRAGVRGRLVRELSGDPERYVCDWQGVCDMRDGRRVTLADPFATAAEWTDRPRPPGDDVQPGLVEGVVQRLRAFRDRGTSSSTPRSP